MATQHPREPTRFRGDEIGNMLAIKLSDIPTEAASQADGGADAITTSEIKIFPDASVFHPSDPEAPLQFGTEFRAGMLKSFSESGLDVQLDFNHLSGGSFLGYPSQSDGAAAGWITQLHDRGADGLHATVQWTDAGLKAVRAREYRYMSPEFSMSQWDSSAGTMRAQPKLYAVALTNRPFLQHQDKIAASDHGRRTAPEETKMDAVDVKGDDVAMKLAEAERKLALANAKSAAVEVALAQLQKGVNKAAVDAAVAQGRVVPAMLSEIEKVSELYGADVDGLKSFLSALPVQTRAQAQGTSPQRASDTDTGDAEYRAEQERVSKLFGVSVEKMNTLGTYAGVRADGKYVDKQGKLVVEGN